MWKSGDRFTGIREKIMRFCLSASLMLLRVSGATNLFAQTVTFETIPGTEFALDLSPDGRFVVGDLAGSSAPYLYDCETKTMTTLPAPGVDAVAVSDDGSVVLGCVDEDGTGLGTTAAIWRQSTNKWESLGFLPNALNCPSRSSAYELSADGTIATGLSWDGCSGRGFVWTEKTGMLELPF
jgi:uncharacterized membrane protein